MLSRKESPYDVAKLGDTIETVEEQYTEFVKELRVRRTMESNAGGLAAFKDAFSETEPKSAKSHAM